MKRERAESDVRRRDSVISEELYKKIHLLPVVYQPFWKNNIYNHIIEYLLDKAVIDKNDAVINAISDMVDRNPNIKYSIYTQVISAKIYDYPLAIDLVLKVSDEYGMMLDEAYRQNYKLTIPLIKIMFSKGIKFMDIRTSINNSVITYGSLLLSALNDSLQ